MKSGKKLSYVLTRESVLLAWIRWMDLLADILVCIHFIPALSAVDDSVILAHCQWKVDKIFSTNHTWTQQSRATNLHTRGPSAINLSFAAQDWSINSPKWLPYVSSKVSLENLVAHQDSKDPCVVTCKGLRDRFWRSMQAADEYR